MAIGFESQDDIAGQENQGVTSFENVVLSWLCQSLSDPPISGTCPPRSIIPRLCRLDPANPQLCRTCFPARSLVPRLCQPPGDPPLSGYCPPERNLNPRLCCPDPADPQLCGTCSPATELNPRLCQPSGDPPLSGYCPPERNLIPRLPSGDTSYHNILTDVSYHHSTMGCAFTAGPDVDPSPASPGVWVCSFGF